MSIRQYHCKVKDLSAADDQGLNRIIDQINALNFEDISKESEIASELLHDLAKLIPSENDHILSKYCSLVYFLLSKQKITLCLPSLDYLIKFLHSKLSLCGNWVLSDVLIALTALLDNGNQLKFEKENILLAEDSILLHLLVIKELERSIQYNAFQCLFALIKNLGENALPADKLDLCCQRCLLVLKDNRPCHLTDPFSLKILLSSLKCLQLIFSSKNSILKNVGEILGTLKSLLFYGLPGQSFTPGSYLMPSRAYVEVPHFQESHSESDASFPKLRKQNKNRRKVKKGSRKTQSQLQSNKEEDIENTDKKESNAWNGNGCSSSLSPSTSRSFKDIKIRSSSSDSEFSDVDSQASKTKALFSSIRQNAYHTLQTVVKIVDRKTMFGYWSSFLPDHPAIPGMPSSQTIFTTILKDSVPQVRISALALLIEMLSGSKQYLALADGRSAKHTAFTSLSSILASMINETHRCLLLALLAENSAVLLIQILKCYAVLSENVNYAKISKDILFKSLKHIKGFIYHKDLQVQVACLTVFTSIISSDQTPAELEDLMLSPDFDHVVNILTSNTAYVNSESLFGGEKLPWIVEVCQRNLYREDPLPSRIQSLQLLSSITGKYFHKSELFFPVLKEVVLFCLNDSDTTLQLHGAKLLDIIGRCISNKPNLEKSVIQSTSELFLKAASGPLINCLTNEEHKTLQAAVCDCLSTLPPADFASLDSKQQILYVNILLGLASDSNNNIRGASIRCLGIYSLFPCLIRDAIFFDNLAVILVKAVSDPNVTVRFKASWALGNLSDTLFLNKEAFLSNKEISVQFFYSTGMACVEFSKDVDRVRANAVRSLGNFLHYIPEHYLNLPIVQDFVKKAIESLLSALSANFMKVCWNACYALKSLIKNDSLMKQGIVNLEDILKSLVMVFKSPNFKVRISAAQAISSLKTRTDCGGVFPLLWKQILAALQSALDDVNFREIKHQENLCNQLCYSLCHLASLLSVQDLCDIEEATFISRETLLTSMWKFGTHSTEENNVTVSIAVKHITSLKKELEVKDYDSVLTTLQDILNQAMLAYYEQVNNI